MTSIHPRTSIQSTAWPRAREELRLAFVDVEGDARADRQFLRVRARDARAERSAITAERDQIGEEPRGFACEELCIEFDGWFGRRTNANLPRTHANKRRGLDACAAAALGEFEHELFRNARIGAHAIRGDLEDVHAEVIDELRDFKIGRAIGDGTGWPERAHFAAHEHEEIIGDGERVGWIMRDHNRGGVDRTLQFTHHLAHGEPIRAIEVCEGLIEQHELGRANEDARDCDAPTFARRKRGRAAIREMRDSKRSEQARHAVATTIGGFAARKSRAIDVHRNRKMFVQRCVVEAHTDRAFARRKRGPIHSAKRDASARWTLETGEQREQRAFARTRRTNEGNKSPARNFEGHIMEYGAEAGNTP